MRNRTHKSKTKSKTKTKVFWHDHEMRVTRAFILALLFGGEVLSTKDIPTTADLKQLSDATYASLNNDGKIHQQILDEGRRQVENQNDRFRHATDRAQTLLTVSLIGLGFVASIFSHLSSVHAERRLFATLLWGAGCLLLMVGIAAAAATVVVAGNFRSTTTTQMTEWGDDALKRLAVDYINIQTFNELTVSLRITIFRQATRLVCWGVVIAAFSYVLTA